MRTRPISAMVLAFYSAMSLAADAQTAGIVGKWNGTGMVRWKTGTNETARCGATFRQRDENRVSMIAQCSTPSGRVSQRATLMMDGNNRFSGTFENTEYGITGTIDIVLTGSSLQASLSGGGAQAQLQLMR